MNELIKIEEAVISNEKVNAVSARELHKVLGSKRKFSDWIKYKLNSTNFREGIDYVTLSQTCDIANGASRTVETPYLTLDAAKHIAMLESTDIGHQVRDYFISQDLMSITEIAKDYGISAVRLNKILESESVQYKYHKGWNLYHHYKTQGLTATTTHRVKQGYVKTTLKRNQKGRLFIHDLLKSLNIFATMDEEKIPSEPLSHKSFRYIHRNSKSDKPFEKWVEDYRKDYELSPITMPNSGVTMVDWILT